ncbi:hypothetical protein DXG03_007304, partial [Asterophora parasitica]
LPIRFEYKLEPSVDQAHARRPSACAVVGSNAPEKHIADQRSRAYRARLLHRSQANGRRVGRTRLAAVEARTRRAAAGRDWAVHVADECRVCE